MFSYYKVKKLGEGTYANIYMGYQTKYIGDKFIKEQPDSIDRIVAIKKIKKQEHSSGQEVSAIREIKSLKMIKNSYVIEMIETFSYKNSLYIILEYINHDLEKIIRNKNIIIMPGDIKSWMFMLLSGLKACHDEYFVHRDLKPNNLLICSDGTLKLADFGLTRFISDKMTPYAISRWYRPPELLIGQKHYSFKADMWSIGVIFAEMLLRVPLFAADTDFKQLELICKTLGTPKDSQYQNLDLVGFTLPNYPPVNLKKIFIAATDDALDLLKGLLEFNPNDRLSVESALNHKYFKNSPPATRPNNFTFLSMI